MDDEKQVEVTTLTISPADKQLAYDMACCLPTLEGVNEMHRLASRHRHTATAAERAEIERLREMLRVSAIELDQAADHLEDYATATGVSYSLRDNALAAAERARQALAPSDTSKGDGG